MPGFNINGSGGTVSNTIETSRRNRYILHALAPLDNDILVVAHKCERPGVEFDTIRMHRGQEEIKLAGKHRGGPLQVNFYQVHTPQGTDNTAKQLFRWWSKSVVDLKNSKLVTDYKTDGVLWLLNGENKPVWQYNLYGLWPRKVSPDTLDHTDSAIADYAVTFEIDKFEEIEMAAGAAKAFKDSCQPQASSVFIPPPPGGEDSQSKGFGNIIAQLTPAQQLVFLALPQQQQQNIVDQIRQGVQPGRLIPTPQ